MSKTHKQLFKSNKEYRNGARKMIERIIPPLRDKLLARIPEDYRFVMEGEEFCSDDFVQYGDNWVQTSNPQIYSPLAYITRRPFNPQPKETFAELKNAAEAAGFVVEVVHFRDSGVCKEGFWQAISPKGGVTEVTISKENHSYFGSANCNPRENFCKETGRFFAIKRAMADAEKAVADSCEAGGVVEIAQTGPQFKVGDYVSFYAGTSILGPYKITAILQENVIEIQYSSENHGALDLAVQQVWLSGTTPPQKV